MSADGESGDGNGDGGPGRREVAHRVFAAEFDDATVSYREGDEERAPNYVVTPTGARANRLFAVGVLTEVEPVNDDVVRARIVDPTGAFVSYAGQYQPDPLAFFERADPPAFVALTGKARTFEPEDGDRIYASVRPESVNEVDADTRDRWVVSAAEATLERVALFEEALAADERGDDLRERLRSAGHPESLAAGIPMAIERYGTTPAYLEEVRRTAVEALELVAGDRDAVDGIGIIPDEGGSASVGPTPEPSRTGAGADDTAGPKPTAGEADAGAATGTADTDAADGAADAGTDPATAGAATAGSDAATDGTDATGSEPQSDAGTDETADGAVEATVDAGTDETTPDDGTAETTADGAVEATPDDGGGGLGDFGGGSLGDAGADASDGGDGTLGDGSADAPDEEGMYELDEEERREVEEEYGTEFATGSEVDDPGAADIETPEPADDAPGPAGGAEPADDTAGPSGDGPEAGATGDEGPGTDEEPDGAADEAAAEDLDLEDAVVDVMADLDDGDGVDRESVVAAVVDEHGADPGAAEDAIQDALMSGRCYEPSEGTLKPI